MLYATSKERFRRELEGIHYEIQATDPTEMDLEVIKERANWSGCYCGIVPQLKRWYYIMDRPQEQLVSWNACVYIYTWVN